MRTVSAEYCRPSKTKNFVFRVYFKMVFLKEDDVTNIIAENIVLFHKTGLVVINNYSKYIMYN